MTTAVYVRVSTEEQAREGVSLDAQRNLCSKYIELHELPEPFTVYQDAGISGSTMDRPALARLIDDARTGEFTDVVVLKLDRLTRRMLDLCELLDVFDECDVNLHGVRDKLDTSSASGLLVLHIMGAVAEWERETIRDRTRMGIGHIKSLGYHVGRAPYGWQLVEHDGPGSLLLPDPDTYQNVEDAREMRDRGCSYAGIGRELTGVAHPQLGKRIAMAPIRSELHPVYDTTDGKHRLRGYRRIT